MTANTRSPDGGKGSTEIELHDWPPCEGKTDQEIALLLEERKQLASKAVDDVTEALLNEDVALTDEKVHNLSRVGRELNALADTLVHRVPDEHRFDAEAGPSRGYYEGAEE